MEAIEAKQSVVNCRRLLRELVMRGLRAAAAEYSRARPFVLRTREEIAAVCTVPVPLRSDSGSSGNGRATARLPAVAARYPVRPSARSVNQVLSVLSAVLESAWSAAISRRLDRHQGQARQGEEAREGRQLARLRAARGAARCGPRDRRGCLPSGCTARHATGRATRVVVAAMAEVPAKERRAPRHLWAA